MRETVELINAQAGHAQMLRMWACAKAWLVAGKRVIVTIRTDTRSLAQNRLMWSILGDLSRQVEWAKGKRLTAEGWKDYLTAHLQGQDLVPNMDGDGFVAIGRGKGTSDMTVAEMTSVIDLGRMFGDARGVNWSPTSLGREWQAMHETDVA